MPVYSYLDIAVNHLTEREMTAVTGNFADVDDNTPRVIVHDYGAWVNVQERPSYDEEALAASYPNVVACIRRARERNCNWINFDRDADYDDVLPAHEW